MFGTLVGFGAIVGEVFAPPLVKIFNLLNDVFGKLGDLIQRHQTLAKVIGYPIGAFLGFIAILGTVSLALASFLKPLSFAIFPFAPLKNVIIQIIPWLKVKSLVLWQNIRAIIAWLVSLTKAAFSAIFPRLINILRGVILAIRAFNLSLLFSPVGLFIAGIAAIIGMGYLLYRNWDKVVRALSAAWEWLKNNWKKLV
ncbi:MAG: hypothetical protein QXX30_03060 [Candidatus Aenigmatarchaeota archaeon]